MNLVRFGETYINPDYVMGLRPGKGLGEGRTVVWLRHRETVTVDGSTSTVAMALDPDVQRLGDRP